MIAALGPFFAVDQHAPGSLAEPPWHSMAELVDDPSVLRERITQTRAYLGAVSGQEPDAIEVRVAASVTHLGLVARLISPALAAAVLDNRVPILSLAQLHWQPVLGGAFPLSLPELPPATPDNLVERLQLELLNGPVAAVTRAFEISAHILVGNVASALNGAATAIANAAPTLAEPAHTLTTQLLSTASLRSSHTTDPFRRRSCCLIYRAAPAHNGPLCADCTLDHD